MIDNRDTASGPQSLTSVLTTRGGVDTGQRNVLASGPTRQPEIGKSLNQGQDVLSLSPGVAIYLLWNQEQVA